MNQAIKPFNVMRIQASPNTTAEHNYYGSSGLPEAWAMPKAIAPGISPAPLADLIFHGGKIVPQMAFQNIYLGGPNSWHGGNVGLIDAAINRAMQHKGLNNVMVQYFHGARMSCDMLASIISDMTVSPVLDDPDIQNLVMKLFESGVIKDVNLDSSVFNFILPSGTVLKVGRSISTGGLGGYHGSVRFDHGGQTKNIYYSANVFSEILAGGSHNGVVAFDLPWKNVVATLYHEINEFRTDPDVAEGNAQGVIELFGWTSRFGHEVGDQPMEVAGNLSKIFREVADRGGLRLPVQFMYSNVVHGAEGPLANSHGAVNNAVNHTMVTMRAAAHTDGEFSGNPITEWLVDENGKDRNMRLLEDFWYRDPNGRKWEAPKGREIDGTSIPQALWSIVGSPYTDDYRRASIVHDVACDTAGVDRDEADEMFYDACRTGGCSFLQAKLLYAGVRIGTWASTALPFARVSFEMRRSTDSVALLSNERFLQAKFNEIADELQGLQDDMPISEIDAVLSKYIQI